MPRGEVSKAFALAGLRLDSTGGAAWRKRGECSGHRDERPVCGVRGGDYSQTALSELTIATQRTALAFAVNQW
jgi:hypothetical protein